MGQTSNTGLNSLAETVPPLESVFSFYFDIPDLVQSIEQIVLIPFNL